MYTNMNLWKRNIILCGSQSTAVLDVPSTTQFREGVVKRWR